MCVSRTRLVDTLSDFIGPYRILSDLIGPYRTLSDLIGPYRTLSDLIGPYRTLSDLIGPYRTLSDLIGPYRTDNLKYMATISILQQYSFNPIMCHVIILKPLYVYLANFLLVPENVLLFKDKQLYHSEINPVIIKNLKIVGPIR